MEIGERIKSELIDITVNLNSYARPYKRIRHLPINELRISIWDSTIKKNNDGYRKTLI
jgi:hypothetical protein